MSAMGQFGKWGSKKVNGKMGHIVEKPRGDLEKVLPRENLKPRDVLKVVWKKFTTGGPSATQTVPSGESSASLGMFLRQTLGRGCGPPLGGCRSHPREQSEWPWDLPR